MKRLFKSANDRKICGVCGGIGAYFNVDPGLIRVGWAILACCAGAGVLAYIICAVVLPEESQVG